MAVTQCKAGHYYDDAKFQSCPHCKPDSAFAMNHGFDRVDVNGEADDVGFAPAPVTPPAPEIPLAPDPERHPTVKANPRKESVPTEQATVGFFRKASVQPPVGWVVGLNGSRSGSVHTLYEGRNQIFDFCETAAERACTLIYDAKGNQYLLQLSALTVDVSVNGKRLHDQIVRLRGRCVICCEKAQYLFVPLCEGGFRWKNV